MHITIYSKNLTSDMSSRSDLESANEEADETLGVVPGDSPNIGR